MVDVYPVSVGVGYGSSKLDFRLAFLPIRVGDYAFFWW